jgi:UDP-glucose 4-epimerase
MAGTVLVTGGARNVGAHGFGALASAGYNPMVCDNLPRANEAEDAAARKWEPLTVFGDDDRTPNGACIRHHIYTADVADSDVRALQYLEHGGATRGFRLGGGPGVNVREILGAIERLTGRKVPHNLGPRRIGSAPVLVSDVVRVRGKLGGAPKMSDIGTDTWAVAQSRAGA